MWISMNPMTFTVDPLNQDLGHGVQGRKEADENQLLTSSKRSTAVM